MFTLAFDTTGKNCAIALLQNDKTISSFAKSLDYGQSELLLPQIGHMLENEKIDFGDIDLVTVCVGPGSFTGVRAGISAARTFKVARPNLDLAGINAFEAYLNAMTAEELADCNAVVIETKREDFYYQLFNKNLEAMTPPGAAAREEIIKQLRGKKVAVTGDGVERFLSSSTGLNLTFIKTPEAIDVVTLALLGIRKLKNKELDYPKPLYLRAPDTTKP